MPISMKFPKTIENPLDKISMVLTQPRENPEKDVARFAGALKMKGTPKDLGALVALESAGGVLHCFSASTSMRWENLKAFTCEKKPAVLDITKPEELRKIADEFIKKMELSDANAQFSNISYGTTASSTNRSKTEPKPLTTCAYVNYAFKVDNIPVFGAGAKMRVTIGPGGAVIGCYKFWRSPQKNGEVRPLISYPLAQRYFRAAPIFADLSSNAQAVVSRVRAGYLALGPRHSQGALIPVYEITGSIATAWEQPSEFTRHLIAIDFTNDDLKKNYVAGIHLIAGGCNIM